MNHNHLMIFEHASDAVLASDDSLRIVFWNKKAEDLFGCPAEEVIGERCHEVVCQCHDDPISAEPNCGAFCNAVKAAREGFEVKPSTVRLRRPGGNELMVKVDHTIVYPHSSQRGSSFLILHFLRPVPDGESPVHGLRIHLLGPTRVHLARGKQSESALWNRSTVRALMALLVLHRNHGIHRDALLDLLWPEKEREQALANLNTNIYYLRRALQPDLARGEQSRYIQIEGERYRLAHAEEHWVDVEAFEDALWRAQHSLEAAEAIALYEKALALYQGDFLADVDLADGRFLIKGQHLRDCYLTAMKKLAALYEDEGRERHAEELYLETLGQDQLQEDACRRAMRLMLRRGDRTGAINHFLSLERCLESELGVRPEPQTIALYRQARGTGPFHNPGGNGANRLQV